ncbi:AbrB/MazE/SpoVT family DNA-binding domain-containing protein [Jiella mangrovi]|uniref:AbrB/MazE/SpoVT family DNA-binding domain-containing protein n=1 Tax=Jiella mangrovi TaxID=2821407 RepID=A0ABS4BCS3_9HYPH|nr:type II toxin-antitoxin system PrlF family antitoxin [Jiella mangrovi]MBP0614332.1 AbrB/MazE/SpoVT family DNA-binding domain-containing protein [Jiella mangrovi]
MFETTISSKGQVTLPKPVRDALKLKQGDRIAFVLIDGAVVIQPRNGSVEDLFGALSAYAVEGTTLDDYDGAIAQGIADHVDGPARMKKHSA